MFAAALCFTACFDSNNTMGSSNIISYYDSNINDSSSQAIFSYNSSSFFENSSEPAYKTVYLYGETEIPDIPCGYTDYEGKAGVSADNPALQQTLKEALDSMIFETVKYGDYTVNLVGDTVRTDKANFPTSIYTQNLHVEVRKDGKPLDSVAVYSTTLNYLSQNFTEYILYSDKIGSYIDVYGLEVPVIAMRYYFGDDGREVTKAVDFATIQNDEVCDEFVGVCAEGTGVEPNTENAGYKNALVLNTGNYTKCRASIFSADEFSVVNDNQLVDNDLNISYNFTFTDPPVMELYSTKAVE